MGQEAVLNITCQGGLDREKNPHQMYKNPGAAIRLENYEASIDGGYRRINGYAKWGANSGSYTPPADSPVLGLFPYATGIVRCQGSQVYFSTDGGTWTDVNAASPRSSAGRYSIALYEGDSSNYTYGTIYLADGTNHIGKLTITNPTTPTYTYTTLDPATTAAPAAASIVEVYKDRLIAAGNSSAPNVLYWSGRFTLDDFTKSSAGYIELTDVIVGLKAFRERLFVFCRNSIYVVEGIDVAAQLQIQPVTKNIGCMSKESIQEIGGDLVFLAHDGIRTLGATTKIGDIALTTISTPIELLLPDIRQSAIDNNISSLVIRNKNQYRLFYINSGFATAKQRGICGTLKYGEQGLMWEWSELKGIESYTSASQITVDKYERIYHGDLHGYVFQQETGDTFDGSVIKSYYQTPYFNLDDPSVMKTLHYIYLTIVGEGSIPSSALNITAKYDFEDSGVGQPTPVSITAISSGSVYGGATYGSATYGSTLIQNQKILLEGSGHVISLLFISEAAAASFTINGLTAVLTMGKRI